MIRAQEELEKCARESREIEETYVCQSILLCSRISEVDVLHLQETLGRGSDPLKPSGIRKDELEIGSGKLKV